MHDTIVPVNRLLLVLLVLGLSGVVAACSAPEKNRETGKQDTSTTAAGPHTADSIVANAAPPAPPPGTARIQGSVLSCGGTEADGKRRCEITIENVTAYGASTPPLATGTRMVVAARSVFSSRGVEALTSAGMLTMTLEHSGDRPQMGQPSEPSPSWRLAKTSEE